VKLWKGIACFPDRLEARHTFGDTDFAVFKGDEHPPLRPWSEKAGGNVSTFPFKLWFLAEHEKRHASESRFLQTQLLRSTLFITFELQALQYKVKRKI